MKKPISTILYSSLGALIAFIILIAVNVMFSRANIRLDLTENRIYTLSDNSKRILRKLDTPVTVRFYFSKSNTNMPQYFKAYAKQVEDLLQEYQQASSFIKVTKLDPEPDSDAEDSALMDGLEGQMLNTGEKVYFGLAVNCLDKTVAVPTLSPQKEDLLEYEITNAISEVFITEKPIIGIMSALPVMGQTPNPMMMQMGQFRPTPKWYFVKQLEKSFELRKVPMTATDIDKEIKTLLIIHPSDISPTTEFAIDQHIMRGGTVIAFLDPSSVYAIETSKSNPQQPPKTSSNLPTLLKSWKIEYNPTKILADLVLARRMRSQTQQRNFVAVLDATKQEMNHQDVITSQLEQLTFILSGCFSGTPVDGLDKTVLVESSENSGLMDAMLGLQLLSAPEKAFKDFKADPEKHALAIRLTGKFRTAFPQGKPGAETAKTKDVKADKTEVLSESVKAAAVLLVADTDMLFEQFCFQQQNLLGKKILIPLNDNLSFGQNLVDSLAGDTDMIGIRCRTTTRRPFKKLQELQAKAEDKFKAKVLKLEKDLKATQKRLNDLQRKKTRADQKLVLSPEQEEELTRFKKQQAETRKQIKVLRKELRRDINALENLHKWVDICLMPALVTVVGLCIAFIRKQRSEAK